LGHSELVDLRSDTVTKPCEAMLCAMMAAEVGDDQYGEDKETNLLQEEIAIRLGKEQALWVPSGTMANQIALRVATSPGDDVIVGTQSHAVWHEAGAGAANAGVHFTEVGFDGLFDAQDFVANIKPRGHHIYPPTTMVQVENTHNRCGGSIFARGELEKIGAAAKKARIFCYLDGARLWNAAIASGESVAALAAPFDAVMVSLSKGLGAPGGSVLAGEKEFINLAARQRRMLGGAMRQTGYFAAAGRFALQHNLARMPDDHSSSQAIARVFGSCPAIELISKNVMTNIVVFKIAGHAKLLVERLKQEGVLVNALDDWTIRLVTHLGVDEKDCELAAQSIAQLAMELSKVSGSTGMEQRV